MDGSWGAGGRPASGRSRRAVAGAAIALVLGGALAACGRDESTDATEGSEARQPGACQATVVAAEVLPAVVTISARTDSANETGSGAVIRGDGHILTNDHVIAVAADGGTIGVLFSSGEQAPATLVGRATNVDLAVVKVDRSDELPAIGLDSEPLLVGQPVVALGSPLGLSGSVTSGIVSALGREIRVPADGGQTALLTGAIQTDAAINPGNSGGPLVDCDGNLVGVNTAIFTVPNEAGEAGGGSVGIGFAIPVELAMQVADELIETGEFHGAYFGLSAAPIPPDAAADLGASGGLYVQSVSPGGPAEQAGIAAGDVITEVDGEPARSLDDLLRASITKEPGDEVSVGYVRNGQAMTTTVTLAERPPTGE
jgi:putative serine protease PepD